MIPPERRIAVLRAQIDEAQGGHPDDFEGWRERTHAAVRAAMGIGHPTMARLEDVSYTLGFWIDGMPESAEHEARADGVRSAIAILEGAVHEISLTTPSTLTVNAHGLHAWVAGATSGLWDGGHHRQAVDEATRAIEIRVRAKLGVDLSGTPLMTAAFNPAPPAVQQPRLRFTGFQARTRAWTDAHQGAMHYGQGVMLRIRNVLEHHDDVALDRQVALECLAALSLLARWAEEAMVVKADD